MAADRTILLLEGDAEARLLADAEAALEALFAGGGMRLLRARAVRPEWLAEGAAVPAAARAEVEAARALLAQDHRLVLYAPLPALAADAALAPDALLAALEPLVEAWLARGAQVALCTAFRHVPGPLEHRAGGSEPLRERIRALNLGIARLSQRTGCFVLDLDRPLAQEGGATLGADCFGGEGRAAEIALDEFAALVLDALPDDVAGLADAGLEA